MLQLVDSTDSCWGVPLALERYRVLVTVFHNYNWQTLPKHYPTPPRWSALRWNLMVSIQERWIKIEKWFGENGFTGGQLTQSLVLESRARVLVLSLHFPFRVRVVAEIKHDLLYSGFPMNLEKNYRMHEKLFIKCSRLLQWCQKVKVQCWKMNYPVGINFKSYSLNQISI